MSRYRIGYLLLMSSMVSWGFANPLSDIAMDELAVGHMLVIEVGVGAFVLSLIAAFTGNWRKFPWKWALILGFLEPGLTYLFGNLGYAEGTVVTGLIIMSSETLMLAVLGWLLLREKITRTSAVAIAVGFSGAVLVGWSAQSSGLGSTASALYFFIAAAAAAGYAIYVRHISLIEPNVDAFALTLGQTIIAFGLALIALPFTVQDKGIFNFSGYSSTALIAAVGAGIFGVAIPFWLFARAAAIVPARHAAIALNIIPVVGISLGALLGRGLPTTLQFIGGALVIASLMALTRDD